MKKFVKNLSIVLAAALTAGSCLTFGAFAASGAKLGDVNGDGSVNDVDASTVLQYDAGIADLLSAELSAADVNGDGVVNNVDASLILKIDAGIMEEQYLSEDEESLSVDESSSADEESDGSFDSLASLNEQEKELYDDFVYNLKQGVTSMNYKSAAGVDGKRAYEILRIAIDDHPEIIWTDWISRYTYDDSKVELWYWYDRDTNTYTGFDSIDFSERTAALEGVVNDVVAQAEQKDGDYEKLLFLHDYIADNTQYDTEAARINESSPLGNHEDIVCKASSAYGCLVEKSAMCSGYAKAFQLLAQRLGVDCGYVTGWAGGYHAWNYVKLGDDYYFVDVTQDDMDSKWWDGCDYGKRYEYFLVDRDYLTNDHSLEYEERVPRCEGEEYNYYKYNGLFLETYSYEAVENIFKRSSGNKTVEIKFGSAEEGSKALSDLFDNKQFDHIQYAMGYTDECTYSYDLSNSKRVLTVHFGE